MAERWFFEDWDGGEFQVHASLEEALDVARKTLDEYRRECARDDFGEWSRGVDGVVVGRLLPSAADSDGEPECHVTYRAMPVGSHRKGWDYFMASVPQPAEEAGAIPHHWLERAVADHFGLEYLRAGDPARRARGWPTAREEMIALLAAKGDIPGAEHGNRDGGRAS